MISFRLQLRENYIYAYEDLKILKLPKLWNFVTGLGSGCCSQHTNSPCHLPRGFLLWSLLYLPGYKRWDPTWQNYSCKGVGETKGKRQSNQRLSHWKGIGPWGIWTTIPTSYWNSISRI